MRRGLERRKRGTMTDDMNDRGPRDRTRINVNQAYELRYWTRKFGVTSEELKEAVTAVGVSADAVARRLGKDGGTAG